MFLTIYLVYYLFQHIHLSVTIVSGFVAFFLLPAVCFMLIEDWSYTDALYYCAITLTTVGFGDLTAGKYLQYYLNPFSAGVDFRRQNLTSKVDPRIERIKNV